MKRILLLLFLLPLSLAQSAIAQGVFVEKFDDCSNGVTCFYCGDTMAHYSKNLTEYIGWNFNHSCFQLEMKNFDVKYEVFVDSTGRTCVVSDNFNGASMSWLLKDDVRKWLTNMPDWKPAIKNGIPINSSIIVEAFFQNNFIRAKYAKPPIPKSKKE
jgi:hypothetical protein